MTWNSTLYLARALIPFWLAVLVEKYQAFSLFGHSITFLLVIEVVGGTGDQMWGKKERFVK